MSNVRTFGAVGDGMTDDTDAIRHTLEQGDGSLEFPRGDYLISETIEVRLDETGRLGVAGTDGTATVIMSGEGPAFRIIGTHSGTGDPNSAKPNIWEKQRMPTFRNIEVTATNKNADGFELIETMEAVFSGVLIRHVRHGIRLHKRNRNVLINDSHIYHNWGVGIYFDAVNLHQINICGNHISYNRLGGIRFERSEVRNLQITGNDIEYNNHRAFGTEPELTAEILIDTTAEKATVNEVTIASNTIQATPSTAGCNIRINNGDGRDRPPGLWNITGNVIGNQENSVHLTGCYGITITGNTISSSENRNLLIEQSSHITVTGNVFRRHTPRLGTGVRLEQSTDCIISGCCFRDESEAGQQNGASLVELASCKRISVQGCQLIDGAPWGLDAETCSEININGCTFGGELVDRRGEGSIRFRGEGRNNLIAACTVTGRMSLDPGSRVVLANVVGEDNV